MILVNIFAIAEFVLPPANTLGRGVILVLKQNKTPKQNKMPPNNPIHFPPGPKPLASLAVKLHTY